MRLESEIVALVHFSLQKSKGILYGYFTSGNRYHIAKHFNTTPYLLKKYCQLLLGNGYARREGDHLIIYSIQHIIHSLDEDDPNRKLLRLLRGVYKVHASGTMRGLTYHQVKLKILCYLTENHYKMQEWNNRNYNKHLKRTGFDRSKSIEVGSVFSNLHMFSKYFEISVSTLSRLYTQAGKLRYLVKKPIWCLGKIPGMWSIRRTLFGITEWVTLIGIEYMINLY